MTGTNCTLDAARNGPKRKRQLLGKERLAAGNLFSRLTAHANGRHLSDRGAGEEVAAAVLRLVPGASNPRLRCWREQKTLFSVDGVKTPLSIRAIPCLLPHHREKILR